MENGSIYHIRLEGELDDKWAGWFDGLEMATRANGQTLLTGPVADQAALMGLLGKINSLGLPLLFVGRTECPCSKKNCSRHGRCRECAAYYGANGRLPFCLKERTRWDKRCAQILS